MICKTEAVMIPYATLFLLAVTVTAVPASAQIGQLGPTGDYRVEGRPGAAPTVGAPGGPSLPPGPASFSDGLGGRPPDEILKSIDKDLGKSSLSGPGSGSGSPTLGIGRDLLSPADKAFK
jgi:hypothetical protein